MLLSQEDLLTMQWLTEVIVPGGAFFSKFRDESEVHTCCIWRKEQARDGEEMDVTLWGFLLHGVKNTSRKSLGFMCCLSRGQFESKE